jgi:CubicO group peptidase (beta-lactamase class C family)
MQTRRDFLKSAAALSASPLIMGAVSAQQPASTSEVFADFESGTYEGWTLTGNCWIKEPHTAEAVPGITGFQGKRFLCTLHPKLGTNATGKAVSREFTIEKPFINFLIGGGNYPGQACLNLVVDGKVVRTATGDDSAEMRPVKWNVEDLGGRRAFFEVVDTTISKARGYVMVDNVCLTVSDKQDDKRDLALQERLSQIVEDIRSSGRMPALVLALGAGDKVRGAAASGVRSSSTGAPAKPTDLMMIGSVSKPITNSLIARYVEKGVLKWSTTIGDVFPEVRNAVAAENASATVDQLLCHRSGLARPFAPKVAHSSTSGPDFRLRMVREAFSLAPSSRPGEKYEYNSGPTFATAMVEKLTGKTYEDLMRQEVFSVLGLTSFGMGRPWIAHPEEAITSEIKATDGKWGPAPANWQPQLNYDPSGAWYCNLSDLCRFGLSSVYKARVSLLAEETKAHLFTPPYGDIYGLGWAISQGRFGVWRMHTGCTSLGDTCALCIEPNRRLVIACYFSENVTEPGARDVLNRLIAESQSLLVSAYGA